MTQDELREAVLAALLDYETLKKTRRLKAVKKALRGTVMATVIGSAGFTAANEGRSNQVRDTAAAMASNLNATPTKAIPLQETGQHKFIAGAAHFAFDQHTLTPEDEELLMKLIKPLPKDAELTVIGCTDAVGGQQYNKKLGMQRARTVASYLERHGMKIKAITNMISKNKRAGWMARRVDIAVDSAPVPSTINLPPLVKQHSDTRPEAQTALSAIHFHDKAMESLPETETSAITGSTKSAETKSDEGIAIAKGKPEQPVRHRQNVRGVTHFAMNRHTLASAHKERLMDLIKQLPKDAELTVIGRTDISGGDDYNKNLGMQRAKSVAIFLANHGVKVKAVGSKVFSNGFTGWAARRVDIVVDSSLTPLAITLPPPPRHDHSRRIAAHPAPQTRLIPPIDGKKAAVIEKDITRLIERARNVYNVPQTKPTLEEILK